MRERRGRDGERAVMKVESSDVTGEREGEREGEKRRGRGGEQRVMKANANNVTFPPCSTFHPPAVSVQPVSNETLTVAVSLETL